MKVTKKGVVLLLAGSIATQTFSISDLFSSKNLPALAVVAFAGEGMQCCCGTRSANQAESMVRDASVAAAAGVVNCIAEGKEVDMKSVAKEACCSVIAMTIAKSQTVTDALRKVPFVRNIFVGSEEGKLCPQDVARYGLALYAVKMAVNKTGIMNLSSEVAASKVTAK